MADELDRFKAATRKPVVACLMDVATSGAFYVALGADEIVALPTAITGGIGVIFNHVNLQDAMAQLNVNDDPVKAGPLIDMGSVSRPLEPATRAMLQEMADGFRQRFLDRLANRRPAMSEAARRTLGDGRVVPATRRFLCVWSTVLAIFTMPSEKPIGWPARHTAEVVLYHRASMPARSLYAIAPGPPRLQRGASRSAILDSIVPSCRRSFTCGSPTRPFPGSRHGERLQIDLD